MTSLQQHVTEALIQPTELGHRSDGLYQAIENAVGRTNTKPKSIEKDDQ